MSVDELEQAIAQARDAVVKQGDIVRALKAQLKDGKATKSDVDAAIQSLQDVKADLEAKEVHLEQITGIPRNKDNFRSQLQNVLERRLFVIPSYKIYGSVAGFFDYGPPGCAIKQNITQYWRTHFVLEESMLEVECPVVTPYPVLKASGHVDRFSDYMVTDKVTGDPLRADHILEDFLEKFIEDKNNAPEAITEARNLLATVGELKEDGLKHALSKYNIKSPAGNELSEPFPFNLMFKTSIGPLGDLVGFLRPETAQGIFVNFRDLLYYNGGKLPFAAAQIGNSYRNEIAPRAGLLRVREFTQAEIEHFVNPDDKSHPKFDSVAPLQPLLYSRELQLGDAKKPERMALGDAVAKGIIANETLAYFIGRTFLFMEAIGMSSDRVRFRQHLQHEMAHYAEDCWDCEIHCTYGWVECVGLADRSAYDLKAHTQASNVELTAHEKFKEPREVEELVIKPNKKELGKSFKKDAGAIAKELESMCEGDALSMQSKLAAGESVALKVGDASFDMTAAMVEIKREKKTMHGRNFTPSVIEPSFGIGRIIYCLLEHTFYQRSGGDEMRTVFRFTPLVAPVKATVFPLLNRTEMNALADTLSRQLTAVRVSNIVDTTGTGIGKRYARTDELGVPFAVTVDHQTLDDGTVTVRERDSMQQIRVSKDEVADLLRDLVEARTTWNAIKDKYPAHQARED